MILDYIVASIWLFTILLPINGFMFMAARRERERTGRIAREVWRLGLRKGMQ